MNPPTIFRQTCDVVYFNSQSIDLNEDRKWLWEDKIFATQHLTNTTAVWALQLENYQKTKGENKDHENLFLWFFFDGDEIETLRFFPVDYIH